MRTKRLLILTPLALIAALLQSYYWVPTYEDQAGAGGQRLHKFIEASSGDAKILNPALNADTASSRIVDRLFDGLLDLDENLALRPRLASAWEITEQAYLLAVPGAPGDGAPAWDDAQTLADELERAIRTGEIEVPPDLLREVEVLAPHTRRVEVPASGETPALPLEVRVPARLRFSLARVDQDFFTRLAPVLGEGYAERVDYGAWHEPLAPGARAAASAAIAAEVPVFEHNPEILFELRRGVRFHDGHEFDSGDVAFTYRAIMAPRNLSPRTSDFEPIKQVEPLGPYRVRVVYKRLFSPAIMAWAMGILPEHLLNEAALATEMDARGIVGEARESFGLRDSNFNRAPVGTGAFRFVEWQSDELIHLRRNPDYWDGPPLYAEYFYRIIPDALTREVEFRTGAVDSYTPEPYQVARYSEDRRYRAFSSIRTGYTYIGYNTRRALLADPRVRRALGMAIDVEQIIDYLIYGEGERVTGPYPKTTAWYAEDVTPLPYDPPGALRVLERLGWQRNADGWLEKDGRVFEFNLITNNGNQSRRAILSIAQDAWKRIGVKCNTQVFEWAVFLKDFVNPGDFDAVVLGWSMGVDPDLYQLWHSSQSGPNQLNFVGYRNARADLLIERIRREYDHARQVEAARQLHRLIAEDQPYTFLYAPRTTQIMDRKIVMVAEDGSFEPLRATRSGDLLYFLNRWRKLDHEPDF